MAAQEVVKAVRSRSKMLGRRHRSSCPTSGSSHRNSSSSRAIKARGLGGMLEAILVATLAATLEAPHRRSLSRTPLRSLFYQNEKGEYLMDVFYRTTEPQVVIQVLKTANGSFHKLPGKSKMSEINRFGGVIWTGPDQVIEVTRFLNIPRGGWFCFFVEGWTKQTSSPWRQQPPHPSREGGGHVSSAGGEADTPPSLSLIHI